MTDPLITDYIINFIFSPLGLIIAIIIGMVFVALFFVKKFQGVFKEFKGVPLDSILRQQYNSIIKVTKLSGKWGSLRREDKIIAKVLSVGMVNFTAPNPEYIKPKRKKGLPEEKQITEEAGIKSSHKFIEKEMYIFKLSFNPDVFLVRQFMDFLIAPKFAIVESNNVSRVDIDRNNKIKTYFNINPKTSVFSFANIYLYGYYPLQMTQELAWIYGREKEKEELVNYPKKVVFLETAHSKRIDTLAEIQELEKEKYESRLGTAS